LSSDTSRTIDQFGLFTNGSGHLELTHGAPRHEAARW
jgi:hypothetical protein